MSTESIPAPPIAVLEAWEGLYNQRTFMLARLEIKELADRHPDRPEYSFLLGLTELALRDVRQAEDAFRRCEKALRSFGNQRMIASRYDNLPATLPPILEGLERKTLVSAPERWDDWLRDPSKINSIAAKVTDTPLGRVTPLLDPAKHRASLVGALATELPQIRIQVDTMSGLLGKDLNYSRNAESLIDPNLRVIDGTSRIGDIVLKSAMIASPRHVEPAMAHLIPPPAPASPQPPAVQSPPAMPAPAAAAPAPVPAKPAVDDAKARWTKWEHDLEELLSLGNKGEAMRRLEEAVAAFPQSARLHELKAMAHERFGEDEKAIASWLENARLVKESGAPDRAHRALQQAFEHAKENSGLMLEVASMAATIGLVGFALTAAGLAADDFRRRGERAMLGRALQLITKLAPGNAAAARELASLVPRLREAGDNTREMIDDAREAARETRATIEGLKPPSWSQKPPVAEPPRTKPHVERTGSPAPMVMPPGRGPGSDNRQSPAQRQAERDMLRERALRTRIPDESERTPTRPQSDPVAAFKGIVVGGMILVLLVTLATGSPVLSFMALIASIIGGNAARSVKARAGILEALATARAMAIVGVVLGFIF